MFVLDCNLFIPNAVLVKDPFQKDNPEIRSVFSDPAINESRGCRNEAGGDRCFVTNHCFSHVMSVS